MMKKVVTVVIILAVVFLIALPKLNLFKKESDLSNQAQGGGQRGSKLPVEVLIIQSSILENKVMVTGTVTANESLEIKSEVSGKITSILFQEGKKVAKGNILVQINDEEIAAQLQKERHNQKLNQSIEFRQRALLKKDAISQEEYDNALNRVNTTRADISLLETQLARTKIRAPFDGIIGLRNVSEGAYVTPNLVIATLYNTSPAKIEFSVPGRYSTQITAGKKIKFTIESDDQVFEGEVYAIEPHIDPVTRTLKIRALANNQEGKLIPGQFVKVELILETIEDALLIPTETVIPEQGGKKVFIVKNSRCMEAKIETGLRTDTHLEVISGLSAQDTLITTGILQLREGMALDITKVRN
ncbi:MAG: efflux RND transporter periplasmic adaptor subunit [Flammeovirgaceae bacterium]|nr:efflux RND transporter periplasmic adaptor subunit [Flammeovirgaceae bacterium]